MAELRAVIPDRVGIVDGDNEGHVRWGGYVAGVDAVRGRMAWFVEAYRLRDRMILIDDILMLVLSLTCSGIARDKRFVQFPGLWRIFGVSDLHRVGS